MYAIGSQFGSGSLFGKDNLMISFHYFYNALILARKRTGDQTILRIVTQKQSNINYWYLKFSKSFIGIKNVYPSKSNFLYLVPEFTFCLSITAEKYSSGNRI